MTITSYTKWQKTLEGSSQSKKDSHEIDYYLSDDASLLKYLISCFHYYCTKLKKRILYIKDPSTYCCKGYNIFSSFLFSKQKLIKIFKRLILLLNFLKISIQADSKSYRLNWTTVSRTSDRLEIINNNNNIIVVTRSSTQALTHSTRTVVCYQQSNPPHQWRVIGHKNNSCRQTTTSITTKSQQKRTFRKQAARVLCPKRTRQNRPVCESRWQMKIDA